MAEMTWTAIGPLSQSSDIGQGTGALVRVVTLIDKRTQRPVTSASPPSADVETYVTVTYVSDYNAE